MTRTFSAFLLALIVPGTAFGQLDDAASVESRVMLRPVDRATVRIIAIGGVGPRVVTGWSTRMPRVAASGVSGHGSGVAVGEGVVLTAAHVVRSADVIAVLPTGGNTSLPARVLFVDAEHDIAFLHVGGPLPATLAVPTDPSPMRVAQPLVATGFPVDVRQRYPAAVAGHLSRENNDGTLQVAMSVNGGNSGGPVLDAREQLVGMVTSRGEPRAGIVGIAYLEPLRFILPALARARAVLARRTPTYRPEDHTLAQVAADFVRTSDERPIYEQTSAETLSAAVSDVSTPEGLMLVAAHAWNMHLVLLEDRDASRIEDLDESDRRQARFLVRTAVDFAQRASDRASYLLVRYGAARSIIVNGTPLLASEPATGAPATDAPATRAQVTGSPARGAPFTRR